MKDTEIWASFICQLTVWQQGGNFSVQHLSVNRFGSKFLQKNAGQKNSARTVIHFLLLMKLAEICNVSAISVTFRAFSGFFIAAE